MGAFDKVRVKQSMHSLDIATPDTYAVLDDDRDLSAVHAILAAHERVVFKPGSSHGGEGVLVVGGRVDDRFLTSRGELTEAEIVRHVRGTIGGRYSGEYGDRDTVIVEAFVEPDGLLADIAGSGVPDLRVVVFQGYPVMAMARLPTEASKGTANLHGGGVGVGIDIATGAANGAYQQTTDRWLTAHPDTGASLAEIAVPDWERVLELASRAAATTGLGYVGVDIVFDARTGPVVLEVNRRPGLGIQNVNMAGLLKRLRFVEREAPHVMLPAGEKVAQAIEWAAFDWTEPQPAAATPVEVAREA
jgi:alpha-L-glutamate ligase-like protein